MLIPNLLSDFAGNICFDLYGDINTLKNRSLIVALEFEFERGHQSPWLPMPLIQPLLPPLF